MRERRFYPPSRVELLGEVKLVLIDSTPALNGEIGDPEYPPPKKGAGKKS